VRRCVATILLLALGCGGGPGGDIRHAFEKGDFAEAVALGRHAVRRGEVSPAVHYYYGMALVAVGRDSEGFAEIDSAVTADQALVRDASAALRELSEREGVSESDAARRLRKAWELDSTIELGRKGFAVASTYYEDRDCERAAALYSEAVEKFAGAPECETAYARLSECWSTLGDEDRARDAMEELVKRYPRSSQARGAAANLADIMYQDAQQAFASRDYDRAITLASELVSKADNRSLQQKGRFLLGQAYEATGDRAAAYEAYREVIRNDRGDSGQIVERASARIEALQEAGLK
jgi:tetratricopeptide (TPR) repeat protein